ncbi:type II toxin-antitoxin system HicA family toxin [Xenorhabdus doucetiae]|uniref:type II toxin-antitoxin system HicA family toxin n=1 Tax=Xenorhabdus doucetiae TaxID=351671 RepID=UPI002B409A91|nr:MULTISPECIES: type II toxin-antitoxin system HicA family toxin [unclassified Xenorhabdus]
MLVGVDGGYFVGYNFLDFDEEETMSSEDLIKKIKACGWELVRINGSHHIFEKSGKPFPLVIPHPRKDIAVGTLNKLLKQAGLK